MPESVPLWVAVGALAIAALSLLISVWLALRMRRVGRRSDGHGVAAGDLVAEMERVESLGGQVTALAGRLERAETLGSRSMQRIGIVRYNPFEDTGSNQSFVLAVLDAHGNGYLLTSLHSRQQTRVYLKAVVGGRTETAMSAEEAEAIRRAAAS